MFVLFIDNIHFWRVSELLHHQFRFITIQNGAKFYSHDYIRTNIKKMFIPELLCYGTYDKDYLTKNEVKIGKFYPYGSMYELKSREKSILYKEKKSNKSIEKYDLCLISEDFTNWNKINNGIEEASLKIALFCKKYCDNNNLKLAIAFKNKPGTNKNIAEKRFLSRALDLTSSNIFLSKNDEWWSSYDFCLESKLIVGMASSLLLENLLRHKKVLICDFYDLPWSLGIGEPIALNDTSCSYEKFERTVDKILSQSQEEFIEERNKKSDYYIARSNFLSVDECLKSIIDSN